MMNLFFILLISFGSSDMRAAELCSLVMMDSSMQRSPTDQFIEYLNTLFEAGFVKPADLQRLIDEIPSGGISNPIPDSGDSEGMIHRLGLQNLMDANELELNKVSYWTEATLRKHFESTKVVRDHEEKVKNSFFQTKLHELPPGFLGEQLQPKRTWYEFLRLLDYYLRSQYFDKHLDRMYPVQLSHPTYYMSTPVTQFQWLELMGQNPSYFAQDSEENPVESITWWSALVYANRLSEKYGFVPAYDMSQIKWDPSTSAEKGTLMPQKNHKAKIKINAPRGDYYLAEGFRLPTRSEQLYLFYKTGLKKSEFFALSGGELLEIAWLRENSQKATHPVAELGSTNFESSQFFDVLGNVSEWSWDSYRFRALGKDPFDQYHVRGPHIRKALFYVSQALVRYENSTGRSDGHFISPGNFSEYSYLFSNPSQANWESRFTVFQKSDRISNVGFRLVRTQLDKMKVTSRLSP